ncbi:MAG: hypothetical protein K9G48_08555 [Reyranella sp.]|nr:hypothetical protein [Reyranella sp.]
MADVLFPVAGGVVKRLVDQGDGTHAEGVTIVGLESPVQITGDAVVDTSALEALVGAVDVSKETDPDAENASTNALLRGILAELQAQTALLTTIAAG